MMENNRQEPEASKPEIDKVVNFYSDFHNVFTGIDKLFNKIDAKGGFDFNDLKSVIADLTDYHAKLYSDLPNDKETYSQQFDEIEKILNDSYKQEIARIKYSAEELQEIMHKNIEKESNWKNKKQCVDIISKTLEKIQGISNTDEKKEQDAYFATISILKELVADCALSIRGLAKLYPFNYGTESYSQLSGEEQLVVVVNMAILCDRMYLSLRSLGEYLSNLDKLLDSFHEVNLRVYYVAGLINFKIHRYAQARKYLKKVN